MTSSIIDFLEARLAEDEAAARAATPGQWEWDGYDREYRTVVSQRVTSGTELGDQLAFVASFMDAVHILRHDPARVLREVQAKRRILKEHSTPHTVVDGFCTECGSDLHDGVHKRDRSYCEIHGWRECETVLALAAIYSDHPDFDPNWSTT